MPNDSNVSAAKAQLVDDFNKVVSDTEALLRAMASVPGEKTAALRSSVEANLSAAKQRVRELQGAAVEKTTAAARATDEYVHDNAWAAIGIAAAVGLIIGLVISDRR
ncbi:MAG: DUF883 family protein [Pseudomonadota bacterium]|nr:DUF883 family protein [Pseudomonadota bacterium]